MTSHAKLSTSTRVLTAYALLLILSFAFAMIPSTSDAKRPKKESTSPKTESVVGDTSALYDTTLPSPDALIQVDDHPGIIHMGFPVYPEELRGQHVTGEVWIKAGVDRKGILRAAVVARSSGNQALDSSALAVARECKFVPALLGGQPIAAWVTYPVQFSDPDKPGNPQGGPETQSREVLDTTLPRPTDSIEIDIMPEMIYSHQPEYSREAKMSGHTGSVWIKVLVDKSGAVRAVEIQKGSGHTSLDNAAADAAWKNQFIPAKKAGRSLAAWITYKVDFKISDK